MILIEKADWNAIRAEYIGGGISQRDLAKKHSVSYQALKRRSENEGWVKMREDAERKATAKASQKIAAAAADNATVAARIRAKLLAKLEKEIDALPEKIGSETNGTLIEDKNVGRGSKTRTIKSQVYKLRDLTAAYKDLTADMQMVESNVNPLLQSLYDLERRSAND